MGEFRGIYPAIITPMRRDGEIDEAAFREVMEFNIRAGVHGFWVAGGTGESILLTEDENGRIAEAAADQNRGRVKNIMHVGAATTAQTIRQAERAARAGVEAICAVPPFFYNGSDDDVVEYYRAVGIGHRPAALHLQPAQRDRRGDHHRSRGQDPGAGAPASPASNTPR